MPRTCRNQTEFRSAPSEGVSLATADPATVPRTSAQLGAQAVEVWHFPGFLMPVARSPHGVSARELVSTLTRGCAAKATSACPRRRLGPRGPIARYSPASGEMRQSATPRYPFLLAFPISSRLRPTSGPPQHREEDESDIGRRE